jgi:NADH dehydrogenase/NADH:ubiquinone oxidoreductase subunit G
MAQITINDKELTVPNNVTILEAARRNGIYIPTLCNHPKLTPTGGCRLCIVEVKGIPRPVASCTTPVADGMEVATSTPQIEDLRKLVLELIISDHPNDCMVCEATGNCALQELAYAYDVRGIEYPGERRVYAKRDGNPFIERDLEKCILCGKCVKVCDEVQGVEAIDIGYRGFKSKICTNYEEDLNCEFCGQCVSVCPTGALTGKQWAKKGRYQDIKKIDTVCAYCGTGCNITAHVKDNEIVRITSKPDTWNEGWLCVKGRFGYKFVNSPDRLTRPTRPGRWIEPGMMPTLAWPGVVAPGQFGPTSRTPACLRTWAVRNMSRVGIPSVMVKISPMPPSAASSMASAAYGAGT